MNTVFQKIKGSDGLVLLSQPSYLNFTLSVVFSQLGFNMMNVVLLFLVFNLTQSNFSVAMLIMTYLLPQIILSFFGGIFADLHNKKSILMWGNMLRGLVLITLYFNSQSILLIYLISFIVAIITQFYVPAEAPMIPYLVKGKYLIAANSIFGLGFFATVLISYVLAGPILDGTGKSITFLVLSALFFLSALFASFIPGKASEHTKQRKGEPTEKIVRRALHHELAESYYLLRKTADVGGAFFLLAFSQVIILILASVVPGYAAHILNVPTTKLSIMLFAPAAVGMMAASLLTNRLCKRFGRKNIMNIGLFLSGGALLLFPTTTQVIAGNFVKALNTVLPAKFEFTNIGFAAFLAFIAGLANAFIFIPSQTTIQDMTPEDFRSKIYGLLFSLIGLFSLLPILLAGSLADIVGVGTVLAGVGAFIVILGLIRVGLLHWVKL